MARCRIDPPTGDVVWDSLPSPASWSTLAPMFTDPPEILGDGIPPEAIATGLVDLATHEERLAQTTASSADTKAAEKNGGRVTPASGRPAARPRTL